MQRPPWDDVPPDKPGPRYRNPDELRVMSDADLADYIAAGTFEFDWTSSSAREALVRLLRRNEKG